MIVIPMAGLSSRFRNAGYRKPKYMLPIGGESVFSRVIRGFEKLYSKELLLFIIRADDIGAESFIKVELKRLNIENYEIVVLSSETRGQAETVYLALDLVEYDERLIIFNIDTFRYQYEFPTFSVSDCDGYLETFIGSGNNWSNVIPKKNSKDEVGFTAEKKSLSEYCCTGLYYFKSKEIFSIAYEMYLKKIDDDQEIYIAPIYNELINSGYDIRFTVISSDQIDFCGVPLEYKALLEVLGE